MNEWQPIETAPKDGTLILVGHANGLIWIDEWMKERGERPGYWRAHDGWHELEMGTHWMSLPDPPTLDAPERDAEN